MTSNDTTNQSTAPIHIDDAIEVEQVALGYYSNLADMEVAEAETAGWVNALKAVNSGKVFTDDKLRADRMTRALAQVAEIAEDADGYMTRYLMTALNLADVIAEARRWVEANPEVVA